MINEKLLEPIIGDLKNLNSAINELSNKTKWKLLQSGVRAETNLSLVDIEYEELYIEVSTNDIGVTPKENIITFIIPKGTLSSEMKSFRNGFFFLDDYNGAVQLQITITNIKFQDSYFKKGQRNSNARMNVWYR